MTSAAQRMSNDGVKSVVYYRLALEYKQLYTWTYVGVKEGRIMEVIIQGVYYIINEAKLKNCYSIFRHYLNKYNYISQQLIHLQTKQVSLSAKCDSKNGICELV